MRKNRKVSIELENAIIDVVSSLRNYEAEYRSLLRYPGAEKERIHSFSQYIDCRVNFEMYILPGLTDIADNFGGHLFSVIAIEGANERTRRFSRIVVGINEGYSGYWGDDLEGDLARVRSYLGGSRITIVYSKRKPTIFID